MSLRRVQVIQSHRQPLPASWYQLCVDSVRHWARGSGFEYRWIGDELFDRLTPALRAKLDGRPVVASDLARLLELEAALDSGFDQVVWVDADVLILDPTALALPEAGAWFGREVWVQWDGGRPKVFRKIHNAFMTFGHQDPVLPFYRFSAERILDHFQGPMVAQLVGPKLLSHLHNAIGFDVLEWAGMLSPAVARDLLAGGGLALDRFVGDSSIPPLAPPPNWRVRGDWVWMEA